ncbi:MAG: ChbG/HpnK family deacetylase [Desulfarculaceae bacterium]|nr:ChbG/HpnK family deacetylase [Desulfarculaceae bacterium]MCF8074006.1 ChbG/HpnK family deacetylase [Desulfarculaceae bacterium]MCF8102692.1 ChbG/HpnK family deacetylase [Desulfarculaceae bacterium]MCF8116067.1 ChbG/HpnK family deacetylase [Desulfarculaceae bacterium]
MADTRVIVNADDFGVSSRANENTFELMAAGRVTSATILANGASFDQAVAMARELPACSFGVHLNLTAGPPLSDSRALRPILGPDGCFIRSHLRSKWDPKLFRAVYRELCAQVEKVMAAGIVPSHLDTHHHVHYHPVVLLIVKKLQQKYGIRRMRLTKNLYCYHSCGRGKLLAKQCYNLAIRRVYKSCCVDYFADLVDFYQAALQQRLTGTFEVMVHPENTGDEKEQSLLLRSWWDDLADPIQLISYHDI